MEAADILIVNKALIKIGNDPITSENEAQGDALTMINIYASVRDTEISNYAWIFAEADAVLAEDKDKPLFTWARQFTLPADFLRLRKVVGAARPGLYTPRGRKILSNLPAPLKIIYTRRVTDTSLYPPEFGEVLACKLSFEMAAKTTNSKTDKDMLFRQYQYELMQARRSQAIQRPNAYGPESDWEIARRVG